MQKNKIKNIGCDRELLKETKNQFGQGKLIFAEKSYKKQKMGLSLQMNSKLHAFKDLNCNPNAQ